MRDGPFEVLDEELLVQPLLRHQPDDLAQHRAHGLGQCPSGAACEKMSAGASPLAPPLLVVVMSGLRC
jgi:hypothetical protein